MWIFQTDKLTDVYQDRFRGMKATNKHFPEGLFDSILATDRHGSYFNMNMKSHQVCIAHSLRNIQYLTELDLTQNWSTRVDTYPKKNKFWSNVGNLYQRKIISTKWESDASWWGFLQVKNRLFKCKDSLFTFLQKPNVPYDNDTSERRIRKIKVKQKVSRCFRTEQGADEFMNM